MSQEKVAIVIPTFNSRSTICETLRSVLQEPPRTEYEIIIVDDGSDDGTAELLKPFSDGQRFRIIEQSHRGVSHARNNGWRVTDATWIQFLDSDDILVRGKIQFQLDAALSQLEDVAVVFSPWQRCHCRGEGHEQIGRIVDPILGEDPLLDLIKTANFIATGSQLIRRSWLQKVNGYDESRHYIEDINLLLDIAIAGGRFVKAPSAIPLFLYCQQAGSVSRRSLIDFCWGCVLNADKAANHWKASRKELSSSQQHTILEIYSACARAVYDYDRQMFSRIHSRIRVLDANFSPKGSPIFCLFARIFGYCHAEAIASIYRIMKRRLRSIIANRSDRPTPP